MGLIPGWGRTPRGGHSKPTIPVFLPGEFPWTGGAWWAVVQGCKESDMTEAIQHTHTDSKIQVCPKLSEGEWLRPGKYV